jgi:hypothetical protein
MLVMFILASLATSIPEANIQQICRSATVDSLPEDRASASRGCIGDETSARDQLKREWSRFTAADRSNCASTPGMQFSYVELLTCLEMQRGGNFGPVLPAGSPALLQSASPAAPVGTAPKP